MLKVLVGLLLYLSAIVVLKSDIVRVSFEDLCSESSLKSDSYFYKISQLQDPESFNIQTDGITLGRNVSANVLANIVYGCGQFHSVSATFASKQLSARFYELSIKLDPALLEGYLNLGYMYDQIGDEYNSHLIYFKCIDAYIQVVSNVADPNYRLSRDLVAAECIANIVNKEIWNEFGVKSVRHVRAAMRLIAFSLVELNPFSHGSYNQLGLILTNQGNYNGAQKFFQKSLKLNPTNYIAWLNTGNHFFRLNKFSKAVEAFKSTIFVSSIEDKLGSVFVINNMGQSFREMGLLQEALNSFSVAIVLLFNGKHEVFKTLNDETFHLDINSTWRDIDVNVAKFIVSAAASDSNKGGGFIGRDIREYSLTDMIKDSVVKLTFPYSNQPIVMLMRSLLWSLSNALAVQGLSCLWNQLEFLEEMLILSVNLNFQYFNEQRVNTLVDPYTVSLLRFSPPDFDLKVSLMSCLYSPQFTFSSHKYRDHLTLGGVVTGLTSQKKLKIKIGFISYDWRDHPMGRLTFHLVTKPYLQTNDRFEYEVYCITYSGNDGSPVYAYVKSHCQNFLDFRDAESHIIIDRIKSLELDVLVDLTVHTYRGRVDIPAAKPAPLVINYLGYAGSSGCAGFDYVLLNSIAAPADTQTVSGFSEKMVYLPYSYQTNHMPWDAIPCADAKVKACRERLTFVTSNKVQNIRSDDSDSNENTNSTISNINDNSHDRIIGNEATETKKRPPIDIYAEGLRWICSFNAKQKIDPLVIASWTNILHNIPNSVLILIEFDSAFKGNLIRVIKYYGILENRLLFIPRVSWEEHLHRASSCDILLDTYTYGAHTTSSDVLWIWEPILTLEGFGTNHIPSRIPSSIISTLDDSITIGFNRSEERVKPSSITVSYSIKEYENIAIRLSDIQLFQLKRLIARNTFFSLIFSSYHVEKSVYKSLQSAMSIRSLDRVGKQYHLSMSHNAHKDGDITELGCDATKRKDKYGREGPRVDGGQEGANNGRFVLGIDWRCVPHLQYNRIVNMSRNTDGDMMARAKHTLDVTEADSIYSLMTPRIKVYTDILAKLSNLRENFDSKRNKNRKIEKNGAKYSEILRNLEKSNEVAKQGHIDIMNVLDSYLTRENCNIAYTSFDDIISKYFLIESSSNSTLVETIGNMALKICSFYSYSSIYFDSKYGFSDHSKLFHETYCNGRYRKSQSIYKILLADKHFRAKIGRTYLNRKRESLYKQYVPKVLLSSQVFYVNSPSYFIQLLQLLSKFYSETHICQKYGEPMHSFHLWTQSFIHYPHRESLLVLGVFLGEAKIVDLSTLLIYEYSLRNQASILQPGGTVKAEYDERENLVFPLPSSSSSSYSSSPSSYLPSVGVKTDRGRGDNGHASDLLTYAMTSKRSLVVVLYCYQFGQNWWPQWGRSSTVNGQGMGGSEEAVVYLAENLARFGHRVIVYGDPPGMDDGVRYAYAINDAEGCKDIGERTLEDNDMHQDIDLDKKMRAGCSGFVTWKNYDQFNITENRYIDVFVAWRYAHHLMLGSEAKLRFLWLHDLVPLVDYPEYLMRQTDVVLTQSLFHRDFISKGVDKNILPKIEVLPNAVSLPRPNKSKNGVADLNNRNDNNVFVYASAPNRGLEHILRVWPMIRLHFPTAILRVYYGFNPSVNKRLTDQMGKVEFDRWYEFMSRQLSQDGIDYRGSVDHVALWEGVSSSGFLLYPSTFPETGCITVMRAMMLGAIPITSRYVESALSGLTKDYDLGPRYQDALTAGIISNRTALNAWIDDVWVRSLLDLKALSVGDIKEHRSKMVAYATSKFTWKASAQIFEDLAFGRLSL